MVDLDVVFILFLHGLYMAHWTTLGLWVNTLIYMITLPPCYLYSRLLLPPSVFLLGPCS